MGFDTALFARSSATTPDVDRCAASAATPSHPDEIS
jgi:hypothetical protein